MKSMALKILLKNQGSSLSSNLRVSSKQTGRLYLWKSERRNDSKCRSSHMAAEDIACVALLKACAKRKDLYRGTRVHADILKRGLLERSSYVADALVTMYAKCGALVKAQALFDGFCIRDVLSWTALIAGYAQQGQGQDALSCFERMQSEGVSPDAVTFTCILKACGSAGAVDKGEQIHDEISKLGLLENNIVLGTALLNMYAKCGALAKAHHVLEELPVRDVISWNALIAGYAKQGQGQNALNCLEEMRHEGISPDAVTFTSILKACGSIQAADKGEQIHDEIAKQGLLENNTMLGNALVDMYAKCGALAKAQKVLEELPIQDAISWNSLIAGYALQGQGQDALNCYEKMQHKGLLPDAVTFIAILRACGSIGAADMGKQIHDEIAKQGLPGSNIVLGNALVDMYAKCNALAKARKVFNELPVRDVVTWSALIAGYAQHGQGEEALKCYERMKGEGLSPNTVTFIGILKACGSIGATNKGEEIHDEIGKQGLLSNNIVLGSALVDMYAKCGALAKAQQVLDELPVQNVVSWSALITGCTQHGQSGKALEYFEQMQHEGLSPDAVTFTCILKACGSLRAAGKGEQVHDEIAKQGLLGSNIVLGNALVDMYAKCGALAKAQEVMEELPARDIISWNALIAGYAQQGQGQDALNCFERMQSEGLSPNAVTYSCILKACGSVGAADKGEQIHDEIARQGLLGKNTVLGNALVDMYAKCGALAKAQQVLEDLPVGDVVSWSALIAGYAQQGHGEEALSCFEQMQHKGLSPDAITFSCVLDACSHSGLVDEGQMLFVNMSPKYGVKPDLEHYTCMVALFGHTGHLNKAVAVVERMPSSDYSAVWSAMLGACRKWGDVKVGRWAFERAIQVDASDAAPYVSMANIYAAAGMQEDVEIIEAMRVENKALMKPGCSWWIDSDGNVHLFSIGDIKHAQSKHIHAKLEEIAHKASQAGFSHGVSQNSCDHVRKDVHCGHCEKLAVACALINTPQRETIRIVNNVQSCSDCHATTALVSKSEKRKIVVRDANQCHIFEDGKCSCGDIL